MGTGGSGQADAANLAKVGHVVVVMPENRSVSHMLGYLSLGIRHGVNHPAAALPRARPPGPVCIKPLLVVQSRTGWPARWRGCGQVRAAAAAAG